MYLNLKFIWLNINILRGEKEENYDGTFWCLRVLMFLVASILPNRGNLFFFFKNSSLDFYF